MPITWEPLPAMIGSAAALAEGAFTLHDFVPDNVLTRGRVERGDVEAGFAQAAHVAQGPSRPASSSTPISNPKPAMQTHRRHHRDLRLHQAPYMDRDEVARVLGLPLESVRILPSACGGGFGGKLDVSLQPMLAVAAWVLDRPVRCVFSRIESMISSTKRHPSSIRAKAACDAQGRLVAYAMEGDFDTGAYAPGGRRSPAACRCMRRGPTGCPMSAISRGRSTPTAHPRAPSAASACRRRRSPRRACSTISPRPPASTASNSA